MNTTDYCTQCKKAAAKKQCYCTNPWMLLCDDCGRTHIRQQGSHVLFLYLGKPTPPSICAMCEKQPATVNFESTRVCADCASLIQSSAEKEAPPTPSIDMETMNAYLIAGLEGFKEAISKAGETYNRLIQALYSEKVRVIREITQQACDMEQRISVFMQTVDPATNVAQLCQKKDWGESDLAAELKLLHWQTEVEDFLMRLPSVFTFSSNEWLFENVEAVQPVTPSAYPVFWKGVIRIDLPRCSESIVPSADMPLLNEVTAWNFLGDSIILACGLRNIASAYIIELQEFQAWQTSPMFFLSTFPGVACRGDYAYVLGGVHRGCPTTLCERYSMTTNSWTALPCMQFARSHCYPVAMGPELFVIGGLGANTAEVLHTGQLIFRTLSLELPVESMCSAVAFDGDIYIFLQGSVHLWERRVDAEYATEVINEVENIGFFHALGPPVRLRDEAYFCAFNLKKRKRSVYCFDLGRKKLIEKTVS